MKKLAILTLVLMLVMPIVAQEPGYRSHIPIPNSEWYGDPGIMDFGGRESYTYLPQEDKAEQPEKPKFKVKKFEILESQKLGLADMLARHQRELSERLNIILADLRIAYPDMPENVVLNQQAWTFEAKVPIKQEKDGTKD